MADRIVTDTAGRTWSCASLPPTGDQASGDQGRDVVLSCTTDSVSSPVQVTVGWQWEGMSENGLARMIALASPVPKR